MNPLFVALLFVVAVTHYGYDPLCAIVPGWAHAQSGLFYVLRGFEGAVLFAVIGVLRPVLWPVCAWGVVEESETAVCRLTSIPLSGVSHATPWAGLCGDVTQWPLYMLGVLYLAALIVWKPK